MKLKAWPNFTRQGFKPEHFKIAAIMARQSTSLESLCETLNLAEENVIGFINGCYVVDLLEIGKASDLTETPASIERKSMHTYSGLFKRIAARLGFA